MGHLEGNFTPVLYMERKVPKGQNWSGNNAIIAFLIQSEEVS